jgi:hypothetical protein
MDNDRIALNLAAVDNHFHSEAVGEELVYDMGRPVKGT